MNINELYLCDMIIIGVNLWMEELDKRYKQKLQQQNTCTPAMTRIIGSVSQSFPPHGLPDWAVDSLWHKGSLFTYLLIFYSSIPIL